MVDAGDDGVVVAEGGAVVTSTGDVGTTRVVVAVVGETLACGVERVGAGSTYTTDSPGAAPLAPFAPSCVTDVTMLVCDGSAVVEVESVEEESVEGIVITAGSISTMASEFGLGFAEPPSLAALAMGGLWLDIVGTDAVEVSGVGRCPACSVIRPKTPATLRPAARASR